MSLTFNGTAVKKVICDGVNVNELYCNNVKVFPSLPVPGKTLNNYTWTEIQQIAQAGVGDDYFNVGDRKAVTLNGSIYGVSYSGTRYCYIIGFNHNAAKEGNNTIHFMFGTDALSGGNYKAFIHKYETYGNVDTFNMNKASSNKNAGGWASCTMRNTTLPLLKNILPADLRAVLKKVNKYTDNTGYSNIAASVTATQDDIFLLSEYEVQGARTNANQYEQNYQQQYEFYRLGGNKIMKHDNNNAIPWHLRSPVYNGNSSFCAVSATGSASWHKASQSYGLVPCFVVG